MRRLQWAIVVSCLFWTLSTSPAKSQEGETVDSLFASDEILEVRIVAPVDVIAKIQPIDEEVAGTFHYTAGDGKSVALDIGVRVRGLYRRRPDVCPFPPLRLNFKKSQVKNSLFAGQDKLKLVTHCRTASYVLEQAVISEYLAYRILNLLTDKSFYVKLLRINYASTNDDRGISGYAILIEHKDRLAKRTGVPALTIDKIDISEVPADYVNLLSVFHYLIGNTDYSVVTGAPGQDCCHNHTPFGSEDKPYYSIPYDFDMSGLVAAPYATPNPTLRLSSVQERLYRGFCVNNDLLPATLEKFQAKRDDIEKLIRDQAELSRPKRKEMLKFINDFYRTIDRAKSVDRYLVGRCR
jgi:hypothetical protein